LTLGVRIADHGVVGHFKLLGVCTKPYAAVPLLLQSTLTSVAQDYISTCRLISKTACPLDILFFPSASCQPDVLFIGRLHEVTSYLLPSENGVSFFGSQLSAVLLNSEVSWRAMNLI